MSSSLAANDVRLENDVERRAMGRLGEVVGVPPRQFPGLLGDLGTGAEELKGPPPPDNMGESLKHD